MTKKIPISAALILVVLAVVITFQITYIFVDNDYSDQVLSIEKAEWPFEEKLNEVDRYVSENFNGEIDEEYLSDYVIRGYMAGLKDKHANYMTAEDYSAMVEEDNGNLVGIGVTATYNGDYAALEVLSVLKDAPAEKVGMLPGDLIVSVDGEDVSALGYYPAIYKIRGEEGTDVTVTVLRINRNNMGEYIDFTITRAKVKTVTVTYRQLKNSDIGVVQISTFDQTTPGQFVEAISSLQRSGVTKFIFDLRNNGGGELGSIVSILDVLLPEGPIVRLCDNKGNWEQADSDAKALDAPMVVLVNDATASAAELFAAALRDYEKATLVGTVTYGKGTVQTVQPLKDGSAIVYSTAMYYPPFSDNYNGVGLIPDETVELPEEVLNKNFYKMTDDEDTQLQKAIEVLGGDGSLWMPETTPETMPETTPETTPETESETETETTPETTADTAADTAGETASEAVQ